MGIPTKTATVPIPISGPAQPPALVANPELVAELLAKTKRVGDCLEWQGTKSNNGYAFKWRNRGYKLVHRLMFNAVNGYLPVVVRHKCDNPCCINPVHLLGGSHADNSADMVNRKRQAVGDRHGSRLHPESIRRGSENGNSKLTEDVVRVIKTLRQVEGLRLIDLSRKFNVSVAQIGKIIKGDVWNHV